MSCSPLTLRGGRRLGVQRAGILRRRGGRPRALLSLVRGGVELDRYVRAGAWDYEAADPLQRVSDIRLGVMGSGELAECSPRPGGRSAWGLRARSLRLGRVAVRGRGAPVDARGELKTSTAVPIHAPLTP